MKVTDPQQPVNDPDVSVSDADVHTDDKKVSDKSDQDEPSPFSRVLAKKREGKQESAETKGEKRTEKNVEGAAPALVQEPTRFGQPIQATAVEGKHVVALPPELQSLVREISVVVNAAGTQQVHIELNSNVLNGLHIRIERQGGAVAIQFQSSSDDVARLLSRNADALSQSLADRGINVGDIRVAGPTDSARVASYKSRSVPARPQPRSQGGRR